MTPAEFKIKWRRYQGKETSGYQSHFDDLCRMLGLRTPNEADPSGKDFFCFTDAKGLAEAEAKFEKAFAEEILERLLALNLERAAEEEKSAKTRKPKAQRGKRQDELV